VQQNEGDSQKLATFTIDGVNREESSHVSMAELRSVLREDAGPRPDFLSHANGNRFTYEVTPRNFLVSEKWHIPYTHALMETDPVKRISLIVEAEHAIFNRYLELCVSPGPIEYGYDLQNAINVFVDLKNTLKNSTVIAQGDAQLLPGEGRLMSYSMRSTPGRTATKSSPNCSRRQPRLSAVSTSPKKRNSPG
jgi:hypothetical protein